LAKGREQRAKGRTPNIERPTPNAQRPTRVDFARETTPTDVVTVVATRPLTHDETWIDLARNEVLILRNGVPLRA